MTTRLSTLLWQAQNVERGYDTDLARGVPKEQAMETMAYATIGILRDLLKEMEENQ